MLQSSLSIELKLCIGLDLESFKLHSELNAICLLLHVDVTGMGCEEEDSKFKGESEVQYCVNNKWTTSCTVDWEDGDTSADQVCSLIQSGGESVCLKQLALYTYTHTHT